MYIYIYIYIYEIHLSNDPLQPLHLLVEEYVQRDGEPSELVDLALVNFFLYVSSQRKTKVNVQKRVNGCVDTQSKIIRELQQPIKIGAGNMQTNRYFGYHILSVSNAW